MQFVSVQDFITRQIPEVLEKKAEEVRAIGGKYKLGLTPLGRFYLDLSAATPAIYTLRPGQDPRADVSIETSVAEFEKLLRASDPRTAAMTAVLFGLIRVTGDTAKATKFLELWKLIQAL
jgi:hypothetical protein